MCVEMYVDMRVDVCVDRCVNIYVFRRVSEQARRARRGSGPAAPMQPAAAEGTRLPDGVGMCIDVRINVNMCVDMRIHMCTPMHVRIDISVQTCI